MEVPRVRHVHVGHGQAFFDQRGQPLDLILQQGHGLEVHQRAQALSQRTGLFIADISSPYPSTVRRRRAFSRNTVHPPPRPGRGPGCLQIRMPEDQRALVHQALQEGQVEAHEGRSLDIAVQVDHP